MTLTETPYSSMTTAELRAAMKVAGVARSASDTKADMIAKMEAAAPAPVPEAPAAHPVDRLNAAKAERAALGEWTLRAQIDGVAAGPRPSTPNLDAIDADHVAGRKPRAPRASGTAKAEGLSRYAEAKAIRDRGDKRGVGAKITEEDLEAWIKAERGRSPGITRNQAEQVSYWLERVSCGVDRFNAAWDRIVAAETA